MFVTIQNKLINISSIAFISFRKDNPDLKEVHFISGERISISKKDFNKIVSKIDAMQLYR